MLEIESVIHRFKTKNKNRINQKFADVRNRLHRFKHRINQKFADVGNKEK